MRDTCMLSTSLPTPLPGIAASLQMSARFDFFCRTNSSSKRSGVPTPMKPPTMMHAPFGIIATASSTETAFIGLLRQDRKVGGMSPPPMTLDLDLDQGFEGPTVWRFSPRKGRKSHHDTMLG